MNVNFILKAPSNLAYIYTQETFQNLVEDDSYSWLFVYSDESSSSVEAHECKLYFILFYFKNIK